MKIYIDQFGSCRFDIDYYPGSVDVSILDTASNRTQSPITASMSLHQWRTINQAIEDAHSKGYENDN